MASHRPAPAHVSGTVATSTCKYGPVGDLQSDQSDEHSPSSGQNDGTYAEMGSPEMSPLTSGVLPHNTQHSTGDRVGTTETCWTNLKPVLPE